MDEAEVLYLTTTGRRTGRPRDIEIWFTALEDRFYLVAEHRERANWVRNILADPRVTLRVGTRDAPARAARGRVVDAAREPALQAAVCARFDAKYGWSDGLVVELAPEA